MTGGSKTSGRGNDARERGITIRMYNSHFGDCFLLRFPADDGGSRYVLIDCGMHQSDNRRDARMKKIAEDIADTTGRTLHVVAVTHEHADHINGFGIAKEIFGSRDFTIENLWLAWTEDPEDPVAQKLKERYGKKRKALQAAVLRLQELHHPLAVPLRDFLDFDAETPLGAVSNADIMKSLKEWSANSPARSGEYRKPGEKPLELKGVSGVRCYVLGPPMDVARIGRLEDPDDMYGVTVRSEAGAFLHALTALDGLPDQDSDPAYEDYPFKASLALSRDDIKTNPEFKTFFDTYYGFDDDGLKGPRWRRIDSDWLGAAGQLALNLVKKTNNTSLVLAFELTGTTPSRFLLFVGDAQAGNWASWPQEGEERDGWEVTSDDIKRRTVFYKVGHHGSRNATYRDKGLEMMESSELVAMIPVDEKWGREHPPLHHPDKPVLERLLELTKGRVLRSDEIPEGNELPRPKESPSEEDWDGFTASVDWDPSGDRLWIEYTVR